MSDRDLFGCNAAVQVERTHPYPISTSSFESTSVVAVSKFSSVSLTTYGKVLPYMISTIIQMRMSFPDKCRAC